MSKSREILDYSLRIFAKTFFLVGAGMALATVLGAYVNPDHFLRMQQTIAGPWRILLATLTGFLAPGPRYILYPILVQLKTLGACSGVLISLICGHVLIEPSTFFLEAAFFGWSFPIKRFAISLLLTFAIGFLAYFLEIALHFPLM